MSRYFISNVYPTNDFTGNIVNKHIEIFLIEQGYHPLKYKWKNKKRFWFYFLRLLQVLYWSFKIRRGSIVIFHFPEIPRATLFFLRLLNFKKIITIALIHDFNGLRFGRNEIFELEKRILKHFTHIIVHNQNMKRLISTFNKTDNISILWLFDYYSKSKNFKRRSHSFDCTIAANLQKSNYFNKEFGQFLTKNNSIKLHVYGKTSSELCNNKNHNNLILYGSRHPDDLPSCISGSYGIVWDGDSITTCSGSLGEYLKYNTPHKLSLYLAAGMPVIVWAESAMADWVVNNEVGIKIQSWYHLKNTLKSIDEEKYRKLQINAQKIGILLRKGCFLKRTILSIESKYL